MDAYLVLILLQGPVRGEVEQLFEFKAALAFSGAGNRQAARKFRVATIADDDLRSINPGVLDKTRESFGDLVRNAMKGGADEARRNRGDELLEIEAFFKHPRVPGQSSEKKARHKRPG